VGGTTLAIWSMELCYYPEIQSDEVFKLHYQQVM